MKAKPHLQRCLTECRHCGIIFITHPRNAGRNDLGCPFGCREAHRKRRSTERSVAFYRTPEGRVKKKIQNSKRRRVESTPPVDKPAGKESLGLSGETVSYLQMVVSLVEGRRVSRDEILEMMARVLRQHSIAHRSRRDYFVWYLNKHPP